MHVLYLRAVDITAATALLESTTWDECATGWEARIDGARDKLYPLLLGAAMPTLPANRWSDTTSAATTGGNTGPSSGGGEVTSAEDYGALVKEAGY
jgi:hypothetical protein